MTIRTLIFKYALDPSPIQAEMLSSHVGASRFAYNWALATVFKNWETVKQDNSIPYLNVSAYGLRKQLNAVKNEVAPWWKENSKEAFASGTANASKALQNWFKGRNGKRNHKAGFPRFKSRHHDTKTGVTFTTSLRRLELDNYHFMLPVIGKVKLHEKANTLRWLLTEGGTIGNVTAKKEGLRWFVAINVRIEEELALRYFNTRKKVKPKKSSVGVDVGLKVFLTTSDGITIENPAFLKKSLIKLRKANKRLTRRQRLNKRTGEAASNRWDKAHVQVMKAHTRITNQRKDFLHKNSKTLIDTYELIGVEDLNVKGMVKNRHLSRSISDAGWGEFKRQLAYKSQWYGSKLVIIDRFYPSSKTCSDCGAAKTKLLLSERTYKCDECGLIMDRDLNAALNIKAVAQSCGETLNERGEGSSGSVVILNETTLNETLRDVSLKP
jgi:putative transposase